MCGKNHCVWILVPMFFPQINMTGHDGECFSCVAAPFDHPQLSLPQLLFHSKMPFQASIETNGFTNYAEDINLDFHVSSKSLFCISEESIGLCNFTLVIITFIFSLI